MKKFNTILVFALLVIVPLGSWYYLDSGLNYRKKLQNTLVPKFSISTLCPNLEIQKDETVLIANLDRSNMRSMIIGLRKLNLELEDIPKLRTIALNDLEGSLIRTPRVDSYIDNPYCDGEKLQALYLVDADANVRMVYDGSEESFTSLVEHLAVVLPRQEEKDIAQKKYDESK